MKKKQKIIIGVAVLVVLVTIIILAIRGGGDSGDRSSRNGNNDGGTQMTAEDRLTPGAPVNFDASDEVLSFTGTFPSLGNESIDNQIQERLSQTAAAIKAGLAEGESTTIEFDTKPFVATDFTNLVVNYTGTMAVDPDTFVFMGEELVELSDLLDGDYQARISGYLREQLNRRFPNADTQAITDLTSAEAFEDSFRVADNGIVMIVPLPELTGTTGSHEVLVPFTILEAYKAY